MNFTIVEGYTVDVDYDEFKKDFLSCEYNLEELRKKYDLSSRQYREFQSKVLKETGLSKKPRKPSKHTISVFGNPKNRYISTHNNRKKKWRVGKSFGDSIYLYFGAYATLEEARVVRDFMERNDWSQEIYDLIRPKKFFKKRPFEHEEEVFKEFEEDYLGGVKYVELCAKYGLTNCAYNKLSERIKKTHNLVYKPL